MLQNNPLNYGLFSSYSKFSLLLHIASDLSSALDKYNYLILGVSPDCMSLTRSVVFFPQLCTVLTFVYLEGDVTACEGKEMKV